MVQLIDSPDTYLITPTTYVSAIDGGGQEMHSNTRSTIYDTIEYEQAHAVINKTIGRGQKLALGFEWSRPLRSASPGIDWRGHT
jgi:hypothetical protein